MGNIPFFNNNNESISTNLTSKKNINPYLLKTNYFSIARPMEKHIDNRLKFIIN
jgi:hypothetical protein